MIVGRVASLDAFSDFALKVGEDVFNRPRDDPQPFLVAQEAVNVPVEAKAAQGVLVAARVIIPVLAKHRVGLTRACLPVCENSRVVPKHYIRDTLFKQLARNDLP